ncbi:chromophore lyase CpcT/CpeT [filamentous cyanobacterium LEGE 11480]|uniref:Chromophore lyase CpcT/CpeT n=1 Tax=Romeriopsis navalis LEGE 11480 TaxID=2777977 RepID=A0A928VLB4_9CYAN|nr:chromophore lyase CpcT/CpeT [Romeriopsis navalis]MBE9029742.1 chromophore lyase CpcT/CpeT [Romeriopsis navalis LEGE 11480]
MSVSESHATVEQSNTTQAELINLVQWMSGDFSNGQQAQEKPAEFAHIHVFWRPLPFDFFGGIGMYSEQVYDYDLWNPYRQGIHRFIIQDDQIFVENFSLKNPIWFAGAGRDLAILKTITPAALEPRCGCGMVFRRDADRFIGNVEPGKKCIIPKEGKLTYLVSEVEITASTWVSRDRGFDPENDEYVWGSEHGHFLFEKIQDFSDEVPIDRL